MQLTPPIRRLWTIYKEVWLASHTGTLTRRDVVMAQEAFYAGARSTFAVLGHLIESGETDELERVITRQANQIKTLQGLAPRKRRH